MRSGKKPVWRQAVRRGISLGLVLTALWFMSMTVGPDAMEVYAPLKGGMDKQLPPMIRILELSPFAAGRSGAAALLAEESPLLSRRLPILGTVQENPTEKGGEDPGPVDHDDLTEPELEPQQNPEQITEMTARGKNGGRYLWGTGVCLYNRTDKELDPSVLTQGTVKLRREEGPQILIVHTHGSEAYASTDGDHYEESDPYRTTDCSHNVVRVGEEMATVFRGHGLKVLHDTNLYDYPAYNGSYTRSGAAVQSWLEQYPSIQIVLDVHRDALVGKEGQVYKMVTVEGGQKAAQVMFVVGSDEVFADHKGWQDNLALAVRLQQGLERGYEALARPIVLRSKTYNQELLPGSLLVEVGGHGNTLTEAITGARLWADNVARSLLLLMEDEQK